MKLATFLPASTERSRIGLIIDDGKHALDLVMAASCHSVTLPFNPYDMLSLIEAGSEALAAIRALSELPQTPIPISTCRLLAPIPRPRKNIFCVGWNYQEHFDEGAGIRAHVREMPDHPTFFTKSPTAVTGPFDTIPFHAVVSRQLDWEAELGVIVGRRGVNISEPDACKFIFGYLVANDLSWRDVQRRHGQQWFKGKSLDGSCPMGPWITTADDINPERLPISCYVDQVVKQSSDTSHMYFSIPRILAELSAGMTVEPGDIVITGTPAGVGHSRKPPEFLAPGQILETRVEGLGALRNTIGAST